MNMNKQYNYNSIAKFTIFLCCVQVLCLVLLIVQNVMFYKVNFSVNTVVTVNNSIEANNDKIDINSCSYEALISLSGIGEKKAVDIIEGRPYSDIYEVHKYVGDKTFNSIKDKITVKED